MSMGPKTSELRYQQVVSQLGHQQKLPNDLILQLIPAASQKTTAQEINQHNCTVLYKLISKLQKGAQVAIDLGMKPTNEILSLGPDKPIESRLQLLTELINSKQAFSKCGDTATELLRSLDELYSETLPVSVDRVLPSDGLPMKGIVVHTRRLLMSYGRIVDSLAAQTHSFTISFAGELEHDNRLGLNQLISCQSAAATLLAEQRKCIRFMLALDGPEGFRKYVNCLGSQS